MNSHSSGDQRLKSGRSARVRGGAAKRTRKVAAKSPPRLRERFREETRRSILSAAEQTLVNDGVQGAKMEVIARHAGIAVGTLYNYFADREQLISALLELRRAELLERLDAVHVAAPSGGFRAQLELFVTSIFEELETHRALFRLLMQEETSLATKPASKQTMMRALNRRAERLIALGRTEGVLRPDDAGLLPAMLVGLLRSVLIHSVTETDAGPMRDAVAPVMRFFLEGAGARP